MRYVLVRASAASCGDVVAIFEDVYLKNVDHLHIGSNISIHPMCYLDALGGLAIGDDVSIAHGSTIMTTEHTFDDQRYRIRDAPGARRNVVIGNDVWIGAGARILAGVEIGDHVVIGAGAVVTKSIPSGSVAVGVPARVLKRIGEDNEAGAVL